MFLDLSHDQLLNNPDLPVSRFGISHKGTSNGSESFDSLKEQDLWSHEATSCGLKANDWDDLLWKTELQGTINETVFRFGYKSWNCHSRFLRFRGPGQYTRYIWKRSQEAFWRLQGNLFSSVNVSFVATSESLLTRHTGEISQHSIQDEDDAYFVLVKVIQLLSLAPR